MKAKQKHLEVTPLTHANAKRNAFMAGQTIRDYIETIVKGDNMKRLDYETVWVDVMDKKDIDFYNEVMGFVVHNMQSISSIKEYVESIEHGKILYGDDAIIMSSMSIESDGRLYPISGVFTLANGDVMYHAKTLHTSCFYFDGGKSVLYVD